MTNVKIQENMNKLSVLSFLLFITLLISTSLLSYAIEKNISNPKPASASVYNLGLKSYEQGDIQSAITFFKQAIDLDPGFVDAYYNLGAIYKRQKNFYLAISAFQKAIDINPEDYEVAYELASCYLVDKNYVMAKKYFASIPPNFPKYAEAKQNLEKINTSELAEGSDKVQKVEQINTPETQAQLLAETLTKAQQNLEERNVEAIHELPLVTTPAKEAFTEPYRVVTSNFNGPTGIAKDSKNNIFVANFTKDRIEKISENGTREVYVEKYGIQGPVGLAIDQNDNLYVANYSGDTIVKITPNKEISVLVDKIIRPYYLLYDSLTKKLFVTVQGNDALVEIDTANISKEPITAR